MSGTTKEALFRHILARHTPEGSTGTLRVMVVGDGEEEWRAAHKLGLPFQAVQSARDIESVEAFFGPPVRTQQAQ